MTPPARSADDANVRLQTERILSNARLALGAGGVVAVYLDPAEPALFAPVAYVALAAYSVIAAALAVVLRAQASLSARASTFLFAFDLVFAALLTTFTKGAGSPFFVFVWFAMIASAFRYGLRGAFSAAALVLAVMVGQFLLFASIYQDVSLNVIVVRATYLGVMAFLLGYVAQKERDIRQEAVGVARVLGRSRHERTLSAGLEAAIDEIAALFNTSRAVLAVADRDDAQHVWRFQRDPSHGRLVASISDVSPVDREAYFFDVPADIHAWCCRRGAAGEMLEQIAVNAEGDRTSAVASPPPAFWDALETARAFGVAQAFGDWRVRLYLPTTGWRRPAQRVHLLHAIAQQSGPALVNMYLLKTQTVASERARVARELHDRVVQSLIGLEMQVRALERIAPADGSLPQQLAAVRSQLGDEVHNVRDLMEELRPLRLSGEDLPLFLSDLVERFGRQTGLRASFATEASTVNIEPRECEHLARIVQEALVNVRKHSGARAVDVRLGRDGDRLTLSIEDDGNGFPFTGRVEDDQLWAQHKGPRSIKERARSIGATLAVESAPGRGARLQVVMPHGR